MGSDSALLSVYVEQLPICCMDKSPDDSYQTRSLLYRIKVLFSKNIMVKGDEHFGANYGKVTL